MHGTENLNFKLETKCDHKRAVFGIRIGINLVQNLDQINLNKLVPDTYLHTGKFVLFKENVGDICRCHRAYIEYMELEYVVVIDIGQG